MHIIMFLFVEVLGGLILFGTYRGLFDIYTAFLAVILMLGLSFHVMVRKPDSTSVRMACFTAALWMAVIFFGRVVLEFREWPVTMGAAIMFFITIFAAGASTYALAIRPTNLDMDS